MSFPLIAVCTGNICRSPTLDVVLRAKLAAAHLSHEVSSCGTSGHSGWPADRRTARVALAAGYPAIQDHRGRPLCDEDFSGLLLALDGGHLREVREYAASLKAPCNARLAMDFAGFGGNVPLRRGVDVPDPYYESDAAFPEVLRMCEASADGVVAALQRCRALGIIGAGELMGALLGDLEALRGSGGGGAGAR